MAAVKNKSVLLAQGERILASLRAGHALNGHDLDFLRSIHEMIEARALRMVITYGSLFAAVALPLLLAEWLFGFRNQALNTTLIGMLMTSFFLQFVWLHTGGRDCQHHAIMHNVERIECGKCGEKMRTERVRFLQLKRCPRCDAALHEVFAASHY